MKRAFAFVALVLGGIGLVACLAGVVAIWMVRPAALRASAEVLEAADDGLKMVKEKTARADELVKNIRASVDSIDSRIRKVADKISQTPEEEKELKRLAEEVAERLRQVDAIAEAVASAVAFLSQTARLTKSLRAGPAPEGVQEGPDALARLSNKLSDLRDILAKLRDKKDLRKDIVDNVVRVGREANEDLRAVGAQLQDVRGKAAAWRTEIADLRTAIPTWIEWAAIIGSVVLAWLGLGQIALARWGWGRLRTRDAR